MKYTIYAADRSGHSWHLFQTDIPEVALEALRQGRDAHPHRVYGVFETDDPEKGDMEMELEEAAL